MSVAGSTSIERCVREAMSVLLPIHLVLRLLRCSGMGTYGHDAITNHANEHIEKMALLPNTQRKTELSLINMRESSGLG